MKNLSILVLSILFFIIGCEKEKWEKNLSCNLEEVPLQNKQSFNVLFLGTNLTAQNNTPRLVSKLAKSMGDSLFYLTMAPNDYDFYRHFYDNSTRNMISDFSWDYIVLQESGWRNALPQTMADTMSFQWADSLKNFINKHAPNTKLILFLTNGFENGVNIIDKNWARNDPNVSNYSGMQNRIKENCLTLSSKLDAEIAPCGILWEICLDCDSTLILFLPDKINPTIEGSYLSACTLYSSIFKKIIKSAYMPSEIPSERAAFFQNSVSQALFECNPDWRYY